MTILHAFVTVSIVVAVTSLALVAVAAVVAALGAGGWREDAPEGHEALSSSRFTIPVSIIVPVLNGDAAVSRTISSLLALNYPEFEVIVVADGVPREVLEVLADDWRLESREFFYRRTLETAAVRRIYRSAADARLMVIDKTAAGYSDALNCGVNVSRYRYLMSMSPEVVFDSDALLRVMAAALHDPANVVGASNHVERGAEATDSSDARLVDEPAVVRHGANDEHIGLMTRVGAVFQRLASARSIMDSRLAWRRLGAGLDPNGAVVVWRRDAVIKLQGFAPAAADADLDMMFRLQAAGDGDGGRFDRGVDVFGRVGPRPMRRAIRMAGKRQLAALQIVRMWLRGAHSINPRALDPRAMAYFIGSELVTPLAELWIVLATLAGVGAGWYNWRVAVLAVALLSFGSAAVTAAALLLRGALPGAPDDSDLRKLLVAGPLEFVLYRPALAVARVAAMLSFVTAVASINLRTNRAAHPILPN